MTEITTPTQIAIPGKEFLQSVEPIDRQNLEQLASRIKARAERKNIEVHPLSVAKEEFAKFQDFIRGGLSGLDGKIRIIEPYVDREEYDRDTLGAVIFTPREGQPIEFLPISQDRVEEGLQAYLNSRQDPYSILL